MNASVLLREKAVLVEAGLKSRVQGLDTWPVLQTAMEYSLMAGGKRIRSSLLLITAECFGGAEADAMPLALAMEMIHTSSLIHDDLPAMDNDTLRRGKPTCHVAFGEAQAILAGDSLLNLAYETMMAHCPAGNGYWAAAACIAKAAGACGMMGGQSIDLEYTHKRMDNATLYKMHGMKTGALLEASLRAGALAANAGDESTEAVSRYGRSIGLLFQITDDILDATSTTEAMGKSVGKDSAGEKNTFVTLWGLEAAKEMAEREREEAIRAASAMGEQGQWFEAFAQLMATRTN